VANTLRTDTTVTIIGAGPAGLTLANLLQRSGVQCVVVERHSRAYVENRQRAGVVEYRAAHMFERWGLGEQLLRGIPEDGLLEIRIDGEPRLLKQAELAGGRHGKLCPQQILVQRLIAAFLADGGDLRWEADGVALHELTSDRPMVTYHDGSGIKHEIYSRFVAGCDGDHGVSRASIPERALSAYSYDHDIGWLSVLADVPPPPHPLLAVSRYGFAAHFFRGPRASRFYLQCLAEDAAEDWPDERVWQQLQARLGANDVPVGPISDKSVVMMRTLIHDPMSYGRLYLVGDAAHLITPLGGKGMNLALHDAEVLATALRAVVRDGDEAPLRSYSETCLRRVWDHQEFSHWMIEMLHYAGDDSMVGPFRKRLARARLERLFTSTSAARAFADLMAGAH
jgi:p-hydroxybenzoate 3-monooxygenase